MECYFDITMHVFKGVEIFDRLADISEITFYLIFGQLPIPEFYLIVQGTTLCIFEYHVRYIFLFLIVVVKKLYYIRMIQFMMDIDLLLSVFAANLIHSILYHLYCDHLPGFSIATQLNLAIGAKPNNADFIVRSLNELITLVLHFY